MDPRPLKYVAPTSTEGELPYAPEPVVIYDLPSGGGGGGGAVDSVNGKTGTVVLQAGDIVSGTSLVTGTDNTLAFIDSSTSPTRATSINPDGVTVQNLSPNSSATLAGNGLTLYGAGVSRIAPPSSGTNLVATLPSQTGTLALTSDLPGPGDFASTEQGEKADTAVQPAALSSYVPTSRTVAGKPLSSNVTLDKIDVNLSNVDNTSDSAKPVSVAQQAALDLKANTSDVVPNTRTVAGKALSSNVTLVKGDVGLGNVDNTSDANKPISTATQTALNAKVGSPNSTITGLAYYPTLASLPATGTTGVIYYVDAV